MARAVSITDRPPEFDLSGILPGTDHCFEACPVASSPPGHIVVLVDRKPIALDTIVPLMLELRRECPEVPLTWLVKDARYLPGIRRNHVLWRAMRKTGNIADLGRGGTLSGRLALLRWILRLRRGDSLLLNHGDFASPPVDLLAVAVRRGGGRLVGYARWCYPMSRPRLQGLLKLGKSTADGHEHYRHSGDFWLVPHPLHAHLVGSMVSAPRVLTGTPRAFPAWQAHLDACFAEEGILDLEGRPIATSGRTVLTLFYPGNHPIPDLDHPAACRSQLRNILAVVRERAREALVLIKPHLICDLDELRRDLEGFDDLEIRLTSSHPQLLARVSRAAFFTNGSNVMDDMYLAGVPVIDTARYLPWVLESGGSQFPNRARLPAVTPEEIGQALQRVLERPETLPEPELGHLLWPKAKSISACLWGEAAA